MSTVLEKTIPAMSTPVAGGWSDRLNGLGRFLRRNPALVVGLSLLLALFLFAAIGAYLTDPEDAQPLAARPLLKPSVDYPFGTDKLGRDSLPRLSPASRSPCALACWLG